MSIRAIGALLCALGFLCAGSGLVAARDKTVAAEKKHPGAAYTATFGDGFTDTKRKDTLGSRVAARDTTKSKKKKKAGIVINIPWNKGDKFWVERNAKRQSDRQKSRARKF